jgi:hypothetical protein
MAFLSVTRLRLRSVRFLPHFVWHAVGSQRQAVKAPGNLRVLVRRSRGLVFWTATLWQDRESMAAYRGSGAHRTAMPGLKEWCNEAATAGIATDLTADTLTWDAAVGVLQQHGRNSAVRFPSPAHQSGKMLLD